MHNSGGGGSQSFEEGNASFALIARFIGMVPGAAYVADNDTEREGVALPVEFIKDRRGIQYDENVVGKKGRTSKNTVNKDGTVLEREMEQCNISIKATLENLYLELKKRRKKSLYGRKEKITHLHF